MVAVIMDANYYGYLAHVNCAVYLIIQIMPKENRLQARTVTVGIRRPVRA